MLKLLAFPLVLAALGWLFTTQRFLVWYNTLTPAQGLVLYYAILGSTVLVLQALGLVVGGTRFVSLRQTMGTLLITFAFFIVVDWESCFIQEITGHKCDESSPILFASEDGATYYFWRTVLGFDQQPARWLAYVLSPFVLGLAGLMLITEPWARHVVNHRIDASLFA